MIFSSNKRCFVALIRYVRLLDVSPPWETMCFHIYKTKWQIIVWPTKMKHTTEPLRNPFQVMSVQSAYTNVTSRWYRNMVDSITDILASVAFQTRVNEDLWANIEPHRLHRANLHEKCYLVFETAFKHQPSESYRHNHSVKHCHLFYFTYMHFKIISCDLSELFIPRALVLMWCGAAIVARSDEKPSNKSWRKYRKRKTVWWIRKTTKIFASHILYSVFNLSTTFFSGRMS